MKLTIQANLRSVTVTVLEPRLCLSSTPVTGKECPWVWLRGACWPISCPVSGTTGWPDTQTVFSVSHLHFHLTEKLHTTFPGPQKGKLRSGSERFSSKACLWWWRSRCVISGANSLTLDHLWSLIHHDSPHPWPSCSVNWRLCTLLTMHSVTSWLVSRLAAVNWLVLDCVQPHGSGCNVKAYLH